MILSDTHTHLDFSQFDADRDAVIDRAVQAGLVLMIDIGIDLETSRRAIEIAKQRVEVFATVGFHPHDAQSANSDAIAQLESLIADSKASFGQERRVVAVGEVGLDYYRDLSPRPRQQETFRDMIDLAKGHDLPLVIHTRDAHRDTLSILDDMGIPSRGGVFHCFSGDIDFAREVLRRGFLISFTGNITYKNSQLPKIAAEIPLEKTLLETDCPFLAPMPHRGKRSEPVMVLSVAKTLAEIHGVPTEQVGEVCTQAAFNLFGIPM